MAIKNTPNNDQFPVSRQQEDWAIEEITEQAPEPKPAPFDTVPATAISTSQKAKQLFNTSTFRFMPDDFLVINDVVLSDVPLAAIATESDSAVSVFETLRSPAPVVAPHGTQDFVVSLSLIFPPGRTQTVELKRLIAELVQYPLVYIFNNKIRKSLNISEDSTTTMFILESGTIRNGTDAVGTIILDLVLHYFNYKPFSHHCWFNAKIPGDSAGPENKESKTFQLGTSVGYEASGFTMDYEAEEITRNIHDIMTKSVNTSVNTPVNLPGASDAWMHYADHLEDKYFSDRFDMPSAEQNSDFIGLTLTAYEHHNPPHPSQRVGAGEKSTIGKTQAGFPPVNDFYKWMGGESRLMASTQKATKAFEPTGRLERGHVPVNISSIKTGLRYSIQLLDEYNNLVQDSYDKLSELCRNPGEPEDAMISRELAKRIQIVADEFPGKKWTIWSGIRRYGLAKHAHATAEAIDFSIAGVSNEDLFLFAATRFNTGGTGYYPNNHPSGGSRFVHMDVQAIRKGAKRATGMVVWVDESERNKPSIYNKQHQTLQKVLRLRSSAQVAYNSTLEEEKEHLQGEHADHKKAQQQQQTDTMESTRKTVGQLEIEKAKALEQAQQTAKRKEAEKRKDTDTRDMAARHKWIADMKNNQGLSYYYEDPKLRNIFFKDFNIDISSNAQQQGKGSTAQDMVCSAMSITFGHRIAPMKLIGQGTYSWQFLGAGNKTGTMVFTLAGDQGRAWADYLKSIVYRARDDARSFGAVIKTAGSLKVRANNPLADDRNSILTALNIQNIVVTEVSESSDPDGADKHQLVVNFISQEFAEEKFDRQIIDSFDVRKRIIAALMKLVYPVNRPVFKEKFYTKIREKDNYLIFPSKEYFERRSVSEVAKEVASFNSTGVWADGQGRPWKKKGGMPSWLGEIVEEAARICQEADNAMPPVAWKVDLNSSETWATRYAQFGAGDIFHGRVLNIAPADKNTSAKLTTESTTSSIAESVGLFAADGRSAAREYLDIILKDLNDMYQGRFDKNGGSDTNRIHDRVFNRWVDKMSLLIKRVKGYVSDKKDFQKFFGTLGDEMLSMVIAGFNECYEDMNLPEHPTLEGLILPPEFYIYDDSKEDSAISAFTDEKNMKHFLRLHIQNEIKSIYHYTHEIMLGGSYLSRNLPKIQQSRLQYLQDFGPAPINYAEKYKYSNAITDFHETDSEMEFMSFSRMLSEGTTVWEPVFYRANDPAYNAGDAARHIELIGKDFGTGPEGTLSFLRDATKLSAYLQDGHDYPGSPWKTAYNQDSNLDLVETLYDNWQNIAFGPNPDYREIDQIITGNPVTDTDRASRERLQEQEAQVEALVTGESATVVKGHDRAVTADGGVILGARSIETEEATKETNERLKNRAKAMDVIERQRAQTAAAIKVGEAAAKFASGDKDAKPVKALVYPDYSMAPDNVLARIRKGQIDLTSAMDDLQHPIKNKFESGKEVETLSNMLSKMAIGTKAKDMSMRRTFPTFKIYFIEDDFEETELVDGKVMRAFDDFYSYSAIQEIIVYRSRKVAADLATIRMTNVGGILLRKRFNEERITAYDVEEAESGVNAEYATGIFADTDQENPFERMVLQDGVKVQIRLGYASDPKDLESVFLGSIVEITPINNGKMLEITCQGFGAELENVEFGPLEDGPVYYSSQQVLATSMIQPSIVSFGRRSKFNRFVSAEARHSFLAKEGRSFLSGLNPAEAFAKWGRDRLYKEFYKYSFKNYPQDDNIFAPPPSTYSSRWTRFWNNACLYRPLKQTSWQIFKEHELRHPGYIAAAVPYGHSPRMTMFFGAKGQHYWAYPPSAIELYLANSANNDLIRMRGMSREQLEHPDFIQQFKQLAHKNKKLATALIQDLTIVGAPTVSTVLAEEIGRYRPFRNYHYFDSSHHILQNNIRSSRDGVYNQVEVLYFEDEGDLDDPDPEDLAENLQALTRGQAGLLACKLDENIPEEHIRSYRQEFPSCITSDMAKRYTQGLFARHLRDAYKGELMVLGEPTLKPYDICYLLDTTINMVGPIEVEAVEHIFNRDHGFISIVTPDLCVDINEFYSATTFDVAAASMAYTFGLSSPDTAMAMSFLATPIPFLAWSAAVKFISWTQEGVPVVTTPLCLEGRPFLSVSLGPKRTSLFTTLSGQWRQYWDDFDAAWDKFDIAETVFDLKLNFNEWFGEFLGGGLPELEEFEG